MGARDGGNLTEQERAMLAQLAAMAEADDPKLASRLRGEATDGRVGPARRGVGQRALEPRAPGSDRGTWWGVSKVRRWGSGVVLPAPLRHWGWGALLGGVGLVAMVISLSVGPLLGLVGVVVCFAGAWRLAVTLPTPGSRRPPGPTTPGPGPTGSSPGGSSPSGF